MENLKIYSSINKLNNKIEIKTVNNLADFKKVIIVFRDFPYYEVLNDKDMEEEYEGYQDNGIVFGAYVNDEIVGLNCIAYESEEKHSIAFVDPKKIAYHSGFAVKKECRGQGIGKLLIKETDKFVQDLNRFDSEYARILLKGSMSEGIFRLNGFEDAYIDGKLIIDDVTYIRSNTGKLGTDQRKYMVKKLVPSSSDYFRR